MFIMKFMLPGLAFSFLSLTAFSQMKQTISALEKKVQNQLNIPDAHFGVAFKDLQTGATLLFNEKDNFHAASTMKTPVLIELYKQAAEGRFALTDSILIKNSFSSIVDGSMYRLDSSDDSETALYQHIGEQSTINSLAYQMIIRSSNLATNILIELTGPDNVMRTMKQLGANDIRVLRGVEDNKAYERGLNNTTTAFDLMLLYEKMAQKTLVSADASQQMINILLDQKFNEVIPALLPTDVKVAHKTGSITGIQHDSGIVFLPDGRKYVLVLLSRFKLVDEKRVVKAMAEVSKQIYDFVQQH